ncbi:MAG TPA: class I SAM-dependent methyltransferase [Terriglobales bacterium]|jgi:ubiquinone/menaquinone biosynthesis C-methylase UbiE|nr:class I SAM-dependent methyltransferase [Terriglobales bacterium]
MPGVQAGPPPSPQLFFETVTAFHKTEALKAAIQLEIFTAIGEGNQTAAAIARRCQTAERGTRILCDALVIMGFLKKDASSYSLTQDSAVFLDRKSPAYLGSAIQFLVAPQALEGFQKLAAAVRKGGTVVDHDSTEPEHPMWVDFARGMAPMMKMPADLIAKLLRAEEGQKWKVLGLAVGHGLFEITLARHNPNAEVWGVDWPNVLEVARENAAAAGVSGRYHTIPGSAFDVEYGNDYDLVMITNFLHHFDLPTCEKLLAKVRAALKSGGRAVILEFVPNEDRVSPPVPAQFSLTMLAGTPGGDAYTFAELQRMLRSTGYSSVENHPLPPTFFNVVIGTK